MPWNEVSIMDQRREFVRLAMKEGSNRQELCRRFGISRQTGYKWLERWQAGERSSADRSRRPHSSPHVASRRSRERCLRFATRIRRGARARSSMSCARRSRDAFALDGACNPAPARPDRSAPWCELQPASGSRRKRRTSSGRWTSRAGSGLAMATKCHPLTVVDDHSRYAIGLEACADEQGKTVQGALEKMFRHHGLPDAFFVDNGTPWGDASGAALDPLRCLFAQARRRATALQALSPAEPRQERTVPSNAEGRGVRLRRFRHLNEVQRALDRVARDLQLRASTRGTRSQCARKPLPAEPARNARALA